LEIAKVFNFTSSLSEKNGNKMKFVKWIPNIQSTRDNLVILNKSEINKHFEIKSENDLPKFYGEEVYNRISQKLKQLK
jgi:hypothetical protein